MKNRSARSEILEIMRAAIPDGDFKIAEVVEKARTDIPDELFHRWAEEEIRNFLKNELGDYFRTRRSKARAALRRRGSVSITKNDNGDVVVEAIFEDPVDFNGTRRPFGDLTGKDLRQVAEEYEKKGNELIFYAGVYRKLARKVGTKTVREVMDADTLRKMFKNP